MANLPKEIIELSDAFSSLPNVGPKLSARIALYLAVSAKDLAKKLSFSLEEVVNNISKCNICGNVTNEDICSICADDKRDKSIVLVIEDSLDLINIESAKEYKGVYHVLGGVISPINGIGPDDINMTSLIKRVEDPMVKEVILGLNPNLEGDSTCLYLKDQIDGVRDDISVTRLAKGIPVGGDLEYLSSQTIIDSMKSRINF
ncbi:Recombination protein RecR [Patescibacteria group bacterium]|nr:recombination protein RecR [Candidatus Dojkabacteria bacterium]CAG1021832.1 Recombination protein RecR [Patescibacteria group bacterium]